MISEQSIGGEMELTAPDLLPVGTSAIPDVGLPATMLCDTGRSAIRLALRDWLDRGGQRRVLLPDYLCSSVSQACIAEGFDVVHYEDRPGSDGFSAPPQPQSGDIVLGVHYFGIRNTRLLSWLGCQPENRQWALIEDCVQSPYTDGMGSSGDYAVTSLRKWWPAPDGATLASRRPLLADDLAAADERFVSMRLSAKLLRGAGAGANRVLPLIEESERMLDTAPPRRISWVSQELLAGQNPSAARLKRRENWQILSAGVNGSFFAAAGIAALYPNLQANETPLAFPLRVGGGQRDALRNFLKEHAVYCPVHWELGDGAGISPISLNLSRELLSLPLDQRYGADDMARIVATIRTFLSDAVSR